MSSSAKGASPAQYRYVFGHVVFDASLFELKVDNKIAKIERRPLDVLEALLQHVDEVMTKDELLDLVWPNVHTVENVVANAIAKLRKALGPDIGSRIITHPRIGYRFCGPVERLAIGRKLVSTLDLKKGHTVSGRPHYKLDAQISAAPSREVWRARHAKTQESRIFKFASDGEGLASLKREVTLFRIINQSTTGALPVAKILDWNFESEPFFIECEDSGIDLKTWSTTKGQLQALSNTQRISLARNIADAVSQIHDIGVLHRDLKPANILISKTMTEDRNPSVRLIDFGSGNISPEQTLIDFGVSPMGFTRAMDDDTQLSTPLYLAPEILQGQSHSIQSDVYSLGIIIYQILSGNIEKPMVTGWREDIGDTLLMADIASSTQGTVKDRTPSAAILRDSLKMIDQRRSEQKAQQDLAARAADAEMAVKRTQARRPWVMATGAALALGLCASLFFGLNAQTERNNSQRHAQTAEAASDFLKDVLISADPRTPGVGPDATITSSLKRAQTVAEEKFNRDVETQLSIKETIAAVYAGLSDPEEVAIWEKITAQAKTHFGERSDEARIALYRTTHALTRQSRYDEAEVILEDLESWPVSSNPLIIESALQAKGRLKLVQFKYAESIPFNEKLNALLSQQSDPNLELLHTVRIDLAQSYSRIEGREADAVKLLRTLTKPPFTSGDIPEWRILEARSLLGVALIYTLEYEEAEPLIKATLTEVKQMYGENSARALEALGHLGQLYGGTNRRLEAAKTFGEVRKITCEEYGGSHIRCAAYLGNEGINYIDVGDYDLAVSKMSAAKPTIVKVLGENSPLDQAISFHLATALMELGKTKEAGALMNSLEIEKLTAGAPGARWDLLLGALQTRYRLRTNYSDEDHSKLKAIVDELISIESDQTLIDRASSDLRL